MHSNSRRVIKSEEVNFRPRPGRMDTESVGEQTTRELRMKEAFAQRIQLAEQEAYAKGVADGIQKGIELHKQENLQPLQAVTTLIVELSQLKKNILENAEGQIVHLSLAVAEKVLHHEVTTNPDVIQNVLKEAVKGIVDRENMKIRIHPQDFKYMMEIKSEFLKKFDGIKNIVFEEDPSVGRGGALIETLFGEVDARLDQQYDEIKTAMVSSSRC